MKQNQKILLGIGLGVVILFNVLLLGWLLTNFFSGPNGPGETVAATDSGGEMTGEETTMGEEMTSQELTTEEPTTEEPTPEATLGERIEAEIPFAEIKKEVIRTFRWGERKSELGYLEAESDLYPGSYPGRFMVGENVVCVWDRVNNRIVINYKGQHQEIPYTGIYEMKMWQIDGWITLWFSYENKLMLYWPESGAEIHLDLSTVVKSSQGISRFLEIGSSYAVWVEPSGGEEAVYRYDWIENKVELVTMQETPTVSMEGILPFMIGTHEDDVYYCQYGENADRYILNRVTPNYHLRTEIEFANYRGGNPPTMCLSPDGHLYIMEMFEDRVEISEIRLEPEMVK